MEFVFFICFCFGKDGRKVKKEFKQILIVKNIVNNNIVIAKDFYGRKLSLLARDWDFVNTRMKQFIRKK